MVATVLLVSRMDRSYKSTAQLATGFTSDEAVTISEEKTSNPFEVTTKFINTVESMKSIPVMSLVSYRLILHDLETGEAFRKLENKEDLGFTLNEDTKERLKKIFTSRLNDFKSLSAFEPDDKLATEVLNAYRYNYEHLLDNFSIKRQSTSDFISVEYLSENPFLSAFAVNSLCQEFIRFNKTLKTDRSSESIDFLENLMEEKRKFRDEKSAELNSFKVNNNVFNYSAESESKITQISEYEVAKEVEEKKISGMVLSLNTIENKINSVRVSDKSEVVKINQRILELRKQINELNSSPNEASKAKLSQLRDELQLEIGRLEMVNNNDGQQASDALVKEKERIELELQIARSNLSSIEVSLRKLKYDISGFATKEASLSDLQREVEAASEDYKNAQEKYNAAKNKASAIGSTLRQILEGRPSSDPEPSKAILLTGLAGVGSLAFCIVVILGFEFSNFTIRNASRLESQTGIRTIGSLNQINMKIFDLKKIFEEKSKDKDLEIFAHFLRKLRFEVQNSKAKIFMLASTQSGVGKSFATICISYSLSLLNKRILIIDTNFKTSTLTEVLIPKNESHKLLRKGNDTFLLPPAKNQAGNFEHYSPDDDAPHSRNDTTSTQSTDTNFIQRTKYRGIDIIGNLGGQDSPSEIFAGKDFDLMLKNLCLQYDYILMEGPSLNEYSDTKELVEYADKIIPVFDAESVLNNLDQDSIKYFKSMKSKLLGSVLNKVNLKDLSI